MAFVSADPDIAKAGAVHNAALDAVQGAMSALSDVKIVSTPVDKDGRPIDAPTAPPDLGPSVEAALEEAHRRRVEAGTARSSEGYVPATQPATVATSETVAPSLVVTLQAELDGLGMQLGQLRAQYVINERHLMAQIEQTATRLAMAKEMSK